MDLVSTKGERVLEKLGIDGKTITKLRDRRA
jgi:hypothetical protein